jgi:hypothetical protein
VFEAKNKILDSVTNILVEEAALTLVLSVEATEMRSIATSYTLRIGQPLSKRKLAKRQLTTPQGESWDSNPQKDWSPPGSQKDDVLGRELRYPTKIGSPYEKHLIPVDPLKYDKSLMLKVLAVLTALIVYHRESILPLMAVTLAA